jgi:hypothetical protein
MSNHSRHPWGAALLCAAAGVVCGTPALAGADFRVLYHEAVRIESRPAAASRQHLRLEAYGRRFDLLLETNEGLSAAVPRGRRDIQPLRGVLENQPGSWARLTHTRSGWRGMLSDGHELYAIEPAADLADALVQPLTAAKSDTVMYRLADALMTVGPGFCATLAADTAPSGDANSTAGEPGSPTALQVYQALAADLNSAASAFPSKRLLTGVVADYEFASRFSDDPEGAIIARMDIVDGIFSTQVGVKIALGPLTVFRTAQQPFSTTVPTDLLSQLRTYRGHSAEQLGFGLTHLMTGQDLDGSTVGIAYMGSVCNGDTAASLSEGTHSTTMSALIAAHEIGHNFNAPHDGVPGACATTPQTYLMAPQINFSNQFSSCSIQQMEARIQTASCLSAYVPPDVSLQVPAAAVDAALNTPFTLSFSVEASGDDPSADVVATATLPASLSLQSAAVDGTPCTTGAGTVSCAVGSLAPGESRAVTLQVTAGASGTIAVPVQVSSSNDSNGSDDSAQITASVARVVTVAAGQPAATAGSGGGGGRLDILLLCALSLALGARVHALRASRTRLQSPRRSVFRRGR